jgi:hypothetical protein
MALKLFVDTRKLEDAGHPFMKTVQSLEIWRGGHMIGTLSIDEEEGKIKIIYKDGGGHGMLIMR